MWPLQASPRISCVSASVCSFSSYFQYEAEATWIKIPRELLLMPKENKTASIVDSVYRELPSKYKDVSCLRGHAILTPTNELVDEINKKIITLLAFCQKKGNNILAATRLLKPWSAMNRYTFYTQLNF